MIVYGDLYSRYLLNDIYNLLYFRVRSKYTLFIYLGNSLLSITISNTQFNEL